MAAIKDFRPLYCQLGWCTKADGSAHLSQGKTTVVAGVYGPIEVRRTRERPDRLDVEVTLLPRVGQSGVECRSSEAVIRQIVEAAVRTALHPRAGLHVSLQGLEEDEGLIAAYVNASCLALADSGIAMKCLFAAITVAVIDSTEIVLDPDAKKLRKAKESCVMVFVFDSKNRDILASHVHSGHCSEAKFQESLGCARKASASMFDFYREVIRKKFSKEIN